MKSMRKIRKTNDLLYLSSPQKENIGPENNMSSNTISASLAGKKLDKKAPRKIRNSEAYSNSTMHERDNSCIGTLKFNETQLPLENSLANHETKKRKIIKAKRLLQNSQMSATFNNLEQLKTQGIGKRDLTILTHKDSNLNIEISAFEHPTLISEKEINTTHDQSISTLNFTSHALSSTQLSPSLNSTENNLASPQLDHLHFNFSVGHMCPSTSGTVESSSKRRTYELEDSINNISVLKSASEKDSFRISSSVGDSDSGQCNTPPHQTYSKVTVRKKWDKVNRSSLYEGSPTWINSFTNSNKQTPAVNSEHLLKKILTKEVKTSSSKNSISKVKKVPNFAAIHQKALSKVENVIEYKERKENRAKMLLSGKKPPIVTPSIEKENKKESSMTKESRKELRFAPGTAQKEKSPTFIPLPSTPLPKHFMQKEFDSISVTSPFRCRSEKDVTKKDSISVKLPFRFEGEKAENGRFSNKIKDHTSLIKKETLEKKVFALKNKVHYVSKTNSHHASNLTKNELNVMQMKNLKSVISKGKPTTDTLASRRCAIKGVRSNRRFELLMNMRKGK